MPVMTQTATPVDPFQARTGEVLFNSSFAGTTRLAPSVGPYFHGSRRQYEDVRGIDRGVPLPHDWDLFGTHPNLGTFRIYYEGGDATQRAATIVDDESNPSKRLLRFWIGRPNVTVQWTDGPQHKARVQAEVYGNTGLRELYQSVRVRLHPSLAVLNDYPGTFGWFTLMEFWNQPFWDDQQQHAYPFRMSLSIHKPDPAAGTPLRFASDAQVKVGEQRFDTLWHVVDDTFAVPFGEWMTLETYYKEGDRRTGRFYAAVTPDRGPRQVLFDVHDATHHPGNPFPQGLTHYNPMKLYTSASLVDFVTDRGGRLELDWSDFSIGHTRRPE